MQIIERGKKVALVKTYYNKERKRMDARQVASQPRHQDTVSDEIRRLAENPEVDLSHDDISQLEKWLDNRAKKKKDDNLRFCLSYFPDCARRAAEALQDDNLKNELTTEQADEIWHAIDTMSKAMRRAKFRKPGKPKKAPSPTTTPAEDQPDLYKN